MAQSQTTTDLQKQYNLQLARRDDLTKNIIPQLNDKINQWLAARANGQSILSNNCGYKKGVLYCNVPYTGIFQSTGGGTGAIVAQAIKSDQASIDGALPPLQSQLKSFQDELDALNNVTLPDTYNKLQSSITNDNANNLSPEEAATKVKLQQQQTLVDTANADAQKKQLIIIAIIIAVVLIAAVIGFAVFENEKAKEAEINKGKGTPAPAKT